MTFLPFLFAVGKKHYDLFTKVKNFSKILPPIFLGKKV